MIREYNFGGVAFYLDFIEFLQERCKVLKALQWRYFINIFKQEQNNVSFIENLQTAGL